MPKRVRQLELDFENWPLAPLSIQNLKMEYSRVIDSRNRQHRCLLGNPDLAEHLFHWFHDTQEEIHLQVSLFRNKEQDFLRTSLAVELEINKKEVIDNWQQDIATLLSMTDPDVHWTKNSPPKKEWKHAIILEINGMLNDDDHPKRLIENLFTILERMRIPLEIQSTFSLEWKQPKPIKKERMPDEIHLHYHAREHWKRHQRHRLATLSTPKRLIRRRIMVFSDQIISSLIRQSIFRALVGTVHAVAKWRPLNSKEKKMAHSGPIQTMAFSTPHNEQIPQWEMYSMLTADLSKGSHQCQHSHQSHDDIPF